MTAHLAKLAVDSRCTHGEGILWCERNAVLYWVDINARQLWRHHPGSGDTRHWTLPDRPGCLGLTDDGRVLIALAKSVCIADPEAAVAHGETALPLQQLAALETGNAHTRSNDGRADRHGNFVFGTMDEHVHKAARGSFYQFSIRHGLRRLPLPGVSIPNSICFSHDGHTLYYCDSVHPRILCCDYNPATAQTTRVRIFATLDRDDIEPDGSIIDRDGYLWNAQWRGWRVVRYRPDGSIERSINIPVKQPTCSSFGGPALNRLHIITSRLDHTEEDLARTPQAGGLYICDLPIAGLPESRVAGT